MPMNKISWRGKWRPSKRWTNRAERQAWYRKLQKEGCIITHEPISEVLRRVKKAKEKKEGTGIEGY